MNKINAQKTKDMVIIGLMAAIICVMGPLSIRLPFTLVPISLTNLAIYFILYVAGTRRTVISYLIYLLIGMCGVPVFSNFSSGACRSDRRIPCRFHFYGNGQRLFY